MCTCVHATVCVFRFHGNVVVVVGVVVAVVAIFVIVCEYTIRELPPPSKIS